MQVCGAGSVSRPPRPIFPLQFLPASYLLLPPPVPLRGTRAPLDAPRAARLCRPLGPAPPRRGPRRHAPRHGAGVPLGWGGDWRVRVELSPRAKASRRRGGGRCCHLEAAEQLRCPLLSSAPPSQAAGTRTVIAGRPTPILEAPARQGVPRFGQPPKSRPVLRRD